MLLLIQELQTMGTYYPNHNYGLGHADSLAAVPAKRRVSEKQLEANRRNAQKSTGPRTEEGKNRSRTNALRHGLTGQINVLTDEDRIAKEAFCQPIIADLRPEGAIERQFAVSIAEDHWRLNRARGLEDNIFALGHYSPAGDLDVEHPELHGALTSARVFLESANEFQLLTLYEQRIHRTLLKNIAHLEALQTKRSQSRAGALAEAARLARVAEYHDEEPLDAVSPHSGNADPAPATQNGFVFSHDEIEAWLLRHDRLKEAAWREQHHWPDAEYPYAGAAA